MSSKVRWSGLNELIRELGSLPAEIQSDGMSIIRDETEGAAKEMSAEYAKHTKTGRLARSVRTVYPSSTILVGIAQAKSPNAHLVEFGTDKRQTVSGANRGRMPESESTPQIARRRRANMARRLVELLRSKGFQIGNK